MTPLRQRMVEDMRVRHFAPGTQYQYIRAVEKFSQHFGRSPERLGREKVREFLVYLVTEMDVSYGVLSAYCPPTRPNRFSGRIIQLGPRGITVDRCAAELRSAALSETRRAREPTAGTFA